MFLTVPAALGYPALATLVFGESTGVPLPGETALITAGGLAATAQLTLPAVVAVAAVAAIAGDTLGYWLGRRRGRRLFLRSGLMAAHRRRAIERADRLFARHGAATVFFGRFIPGIRVVTAVTAGATHMPWRRFAACNALGALTWATTVSSAAYLLGPSRATMLALSGLALTPLAVAIGWLYRRWTVANARASVAV